ncbi:hypothetical protein BDN71DRAFT_1435442 [Pleurotus eryngii]|uniref:Uncharacterized protein n=1 Tax=Pleurotus eryngii TaxID=5323 RepID=A0A9P6D201_PLEER|nr:hypothetical protein BDN71DRAFT_1435442 [Pleurotus eryngii]
MDLLLAIWFNTTCQATSAIRGKKIAMIAHLIGQNTCCHASDEARDAAQKVKDQMMRLQRGKHVVKIQGGRGFRGQVVSVSLQKDGGQSKAGKQPAPKWKANKVLTQPKLKVFKGINILFKEIQKLFYMFQSPVLKIIPNKALSGRLLDEELCEVEEGLRKALHGQYSGIA